MIKGKWVKIKRFWVRINKWPKYLAYQVKKSAVNWLSFYERIQFISGKKNYFLFQRKLIQ